METPLTQYIQRDNAPPGLKEYKKAGGYAGVDKALKEMTPDEVIGIVKDANLLGRGGAGFPTGLKWSFVPKTAGGSGIKYLIANADEMEPGTFKDRYLLEGNPHQLIAGMIISCICHTGSESLYFSAMGIQKG